jgi:hypothetical protein
MLRTNNLNLDIHRNQPLRQRIDSDKPWVHCARESTKLSNETNTALLDRFVWVRADDTARNSSASSKNVAEIVYHATVPAMRRFIFGIWLNGLRVRWLKIFAARRLDFGDWACIVARAMIASVRVGHRRFASQITHVQLEKT